METARRNSDQIVAGFQTKVLSRLIADLLLQLLSFSWASHPAEYAVQPDGSPSGPYG